MRPRSVITITILIAAIAVSKAFADTIPTDVTDTVALRLHNQGLRPYNFGCELSPLSSAPLIVAGIATKGDYKQEPNSLTYDHATKVDSYIRFAPLAATVALKACGVESRSDWLRLGVSAAGAYGITAIFTYGLKWAVDEPRPDGSARNSFPSGHTATAFAAATILHKEYGTTFSPWISLGGYAVAATTAFMRANNNYHWSGDVLAGAGIGILATELAYGISDLIFKQRYLNRWMKADGIDFSATPSWASIDIGPAFTFGDAELENTRIKFGTGLAVGAEAAYLFNRHFGVGGRFRAVHTPVKNLEPMLNDIEAESIRVNHYGIAEYSLSAGAYFALPMSSRFCLNAKVTAGYRAARGISATAHRAEEEWECWRLNANSSMTVGTGIGAALSATDRIAWRVFADFDFSKKHFELMQNFDGNTATTAATRRWLTTMTIGTSVCTYF